MNVTWQRETTTATVDVNDYYLLHLLSPNLQQRGLCCRRRNNRCSGTSVSRLKKTNASNLLHFTCLKSSAGWQEVNNSFIIS